MRSGFSLFAIAHFGFHKDICLRGDQEFISRILDYLMTWLKSNLQDRYCTHLQPMSRGDIFHFPGARESGACDRWMDSADGSIYNIARSECKEDVLCVTEVSQLFHLFQKESL